MSDTFHDLALREPLIAALADVGYEAPTPIQQRTIPALLGGRDVIGQAQTGTGKTAAFALPILHGLDIGVARVQALVLVPTRELSIQVAEAVHTYARHLPGVRVLPLYGGQSIQPQLHRLSAGAHVVIGTPGRVMDHLRRGSLVLADVRTLVLDEADEMLRMGFIEDVEWILGQAPAARQTALFSATMPQPIRRIATRYLRDPVTIEIDDATRTVPTIDQHYLHVSERQKLDALTRILDAQPSESTLVFVRTKTGAAGVAERLIARGYAAEALHGDLSQAARETVMRRLRSGQVEIVVATDVAARGLDIERLGRVVNYDLPSDPEWYVHRVGRTGRAGRAGAAILFVTPREQRLLRHIERYTGQPMKPMTLPTLADVAARRVAQLKDALVKTLAEDNLELYLTLVEELAEESGIDMAEIAAAAARLAHGDRPLATAADPEPSPASGAMVRLYLDAGRVSGVRPADIVGAIANEAGVPGQAIGAIDIYERFSFVEVPVEYRDQVLERMTRTTLRSRPVRLRVATPDGSGRAREREPRSTRPATPRASGTPRPDARGPRGASPSRERSAGAGRERPAAPRKRDRAPGGPRAFGESLRRGRGKPGGPKRRRPPG
jgi:ATP-dependent RNA helicase DeaD